MAFLILHVHVITHTIPICGADEQGGDLLAFLYREVDNVTLDLLALGDWFIKRHCFFTVKINKKRTSTVYPLEDGGRSNLNNILTYNKCNELVSLLLARIWFLRIGEFTIVIFNRQDTRLPLAQVFLHIDCVCIFQ